MTFITSKSGSSSSSGRTGRLIGGYRNLIVWKEAKNLTVLVYKLTERFPKNEEFGLKIQMRKAAVSVMSQIAEGWLRKSKRGKLYYLEIALGSLLELENQGEVAKAVGFWNENDYLKFDKQRAKVAYLLYRYVKKIEQ